MYCYILSQKVYSEKMVSRIGSRIPLYCSGVGRMGNERIRELASYILEIKRQIEEKICPQ